MRALDRPVPRRGLSRVEAAARRLSCFERTSHVPAADIAHARPLQFGRGHHFVATLTIAQIATSMSTVNFAAHCGNTAAPRARLSSRSKAKVLDLPRIG